LNILILSEAFFNLKTIHKFLSAEDKAQLNGALGNFLEKNNEYIVKDARLNKLYELSTVKSRPSN